MKSLFVANDVVEKEIRRKAFDVLSSVWLIIAWIVHCVGVLIAFFLDPEQRQHSFFFYLIFFGSICVILNVFALIIARIQSGNPKTQRKILLRCLENSEFWMETTLNAMSDGYKPEQMERSFTNHSERCNIFSSHLIYLEDKLKNGQS